jgi:hypothetical protein
MVKKLAEEEQKAKATRMGERGASGGAGESSWSSLVPCAQSLEVGLVASTKLRQCGHLLIRFDISSLHLPPPANAARTVPVSIRVLRKPLAHGCLPTMDPVELYPARRAPRRRVALQSLLLADEWCNELPAGFLRGRRLWRPRTFQLRRASSGGPQASGPPRAPCAASSPAAAEASALRSAALVLVRSRPPADDDPALHAPCRAPRGQL